MKFDKRVGLFFCLCGTVPFLCMVGWAAEPATNPVSAPRVETNNVERAAAEALGPIFEEIKLTAEFGLLKELAAEHSQRAEEAARAKEPEKSKWESELAAELTGRVDRTVGILEDIMRQRLAAGQGRGKTNAASQSASSDEAAFFARLDTQHWRIGQELKAAEEATRAFALELQTNNTPDEVLRVSLEVQQNNALIRLLERERSGLELQELQYRALRTKR